MLHSPVLPQARGVICALLRARHGSIHVELAGCKDGTPTTTVAAIRITVDARSNTILRLGLISQSSSNRTDTARDPTSAATS